MPRSKQLPSFHSLEVLADFFDNNDMGDYWQAMPEVDVDIRLKQKTRLVALEEKLLARVSQVARAQHIAPEL